MPTFTVDTIDHHPFVVDSGLMLPHRLANPDECLPDMIDFVAGLAEDHAAEPIDIIVGDDVSGRVPTLVAHRFFRLAQRGGHTDSVPQTFFMASGRVMGGGGTLITSA